MKQLLSLLILVTCMRGAAQDSSSKELSNYERFISRTGVMIRTDETLIGKTRNLQLSHYKATDLSNNNSIESILVSGYGTSVFSSTGGMLSIDIDEVPGVIKALEFFKQHIDKEKDGSPQAFYYTTKNKVVIHCYHTSSSVTKAWFIAIYQRYKTLPQTIPGTRIELRDRDLAEILDLFKKSINTK